MTQELMADSAPGQRHNGSHITDYSARELTDWLKFFVRESNRIEGIQRAPLKRELAAHAWLLDQPELTVMTVSRFVSAVQPGAELRIREGMNVRVGNHYPPRGGSGVGFALHQLLARANSRDEPWFVHVDYETLHPFMDGNGRSGRALWLWQMVNQHAAGYAAKMGFLHLFYYQTLQHSNRSVGGTEGATLPTVSESTEGGESNVPNPKRDPL